jgi:hypothetical protein
LLRRARIELEDDPSPANEKASIAARLALQDVALTGGDPDRFDVLDPFETRPEGTWLTSSEIASAHEALDRLHHR